jgi:hypothetical protein
MHAALVPRRQSQTRIRPGPDAPFTVLDASSVAASQRARPCQFPSPLADCGETTQCEASIEPKIHCKQPKQDCVLAMRLVKVSELAIGQTIAGDVSNLHQ